VGESAVGCDLRCTLTLLAITLWYISFRRWGNENEGTFETSTTSDAVSFIEIREMRLSIHIQTVLLSNNEVSFYLPMEEFSLSLYARVSHRYIQLGSVKYS